jgi:hypothetical protein
MFEYPNSGLQSGLHSAPPTMGNYQPPLQPYAPGQNNTQNPGYEPPRAVEYNSDYPYDSFVDNAIDEVAHNPLAYISGVGE